MECGSFCLSVRLSVCLFVCQTRALWQNGRKIIQIFIPYERSFSLVFWEEEWLVRATPSTWNFGSTGPRWSETADFEPIFARSASTSMTLNVLERRNSPYFAFFTEFDSFAARLCHSGLRYTYNVRKILSAPFPVFHFWPKLTHPQRGLSAIAEHLVLLRMVSV